MREPAGSPRAGKHCPRAHPLPPLPRASRLPVGCQLDNHMVDLARPSAAKRHDRLGTLARRLLAADCAAPSRVCSDRTTKLPTVAKLPAMMADSSRC